MAATTTMAVLNQSPRVDEIISIKKGEEGGDVSERNWKSEQKCLKTLFLLKKHVENTQIVLV
eukprot:SAG11_NODE_332_length_10621_cov_13.178768_12_plen_62_part_00